MLNKKRKWKLQGYDTFEEGPDAYYDIGGEYDSESDAIRAAFEYLAEIERDQPSSLSGGIQDQVFIIEPSGERKRFFPD